MKLSITNEKNDDVAEMPSVICNDLPWHGEGLEEVLEALNCSSIQDYSRKGLTSEEAMQRLKRVGPNQLSQKDKTALLVRIWHHLANVLVGILAFVAAVSALRAATSELAETVLTNWIQVGLIVFVIT